MLNNHNDKKFGHEAEGGKLYLDKLDISYSILRIKEEFLPNEAPFSAISENVFRDFWQISISVQFCKKRVRRVSGKTVFIEYWVGTCSMMMSAFSGMEPVKHNI